MSEDKNKHHLIAVFLAVIFVLVFLGTVYVFFPISNPLNIIEGQPGSGFFYASLWAIGMAFVILLVYAIRQTFKDLLESLGHELGIDVDELGKEYKDMIKDDVMTMMGKKQDEEDHAPDIEEDAPDK